MFKDNECPVCEEGELIKITSNKWGVGTTSYSICDTCESEQANTFQCAANKRAKLEHRRKAQSEE